MPIRALPGNVRPRRRVSHQALVAPALLPVSCFLLQRSRIPGHQTPLASARGANSGGVTVGWRCQIASDMMQTFTITAPDISCQLARHARDSALILNRSMSDALSSVGVGDFGCFLPAMGIKIKNRFESAPLFKADNATSLHVLLIVIQGKGARA